MQTIKTPNKILKLFDETYVAGLFNEKILPFYPDFKKIEKIKIIPIKKHVWQTTYHVVIKFTTSLLNHAGDAIKLPIYFTAHSNEPRKNSFAALQFLWQINFSQGNLVVPHPLYFSNEYNGYFYRGVRGQTLYYYINKRDFRTIEEIVAKAAAWFAKLHGSPTAANFNPENSRIITVLPGLNHTLERIKQNYPKYFSAYKEIYNQIIEKENKYFSGNGRQYLIHGDAHARNVIKMGKDKIAIIDFTDMCLADFARDLGSFMQQLDFMSFKKINDRTYIEKIKKIFLDNYTNNSRIKIDDYVKERINTYYNWTALRTATYFMLKYRPEPTRSYGLIEEICQSLKIKKNF